MNDYAIADNGSFLKLTIFSEIGLYILGMMLKKVLATPIVH